MAAEEEGGSEGEEEGGSSSEGEELEGGSDEDELASGSESEEEEEERDEEEEGEKEQQPQEQRRQQGGAAAAAAAGQGAAQRQRAEQQEGGGTAAELPFTPPLPKTYEEFAGMAQVRARCYHASLEELEASSVHICRTKTWPRCQLVHPASTLHTNSHSGSDAPVLWLPPTRPLLPTKLLLPTRLLAQGLSAADLGELVRRIRAYNAPKLTTEHRKGLQLLYGVLVQHFAALAGGGQARLAQQGEQAQQGRQGGISMAHLDALVPHLIDMTPQVGTRFSIAMCGQALMQVVRVLCCGRGWCAVRAAQAVRGAQEGCAQGGVAKWRVGCKGAGLQLQHWVAGGRRRRWWHNGICLQPAMLQQSNCSAAMPGPLKITVTAHPEWPTPRACCPLHAQRAFPPPPITPQ